MTVQWAAQMIGSDEEFHGAPMLRGETTLERGHGAVVHATLLATARGVFTASINGTQVSGDVLSPGWSSFEWRLRYRSYDVTDLVRAADGPVVLGLELGNGWFRGRLGWTGKSAVYGSELAGLAQLEVVYEDGHRQVWGTDESWWAGPSAVLENDLYDGQTIDARLRASSWQQPGFGANEWVGVHPVDYDPDTLTPYIGPPMRRQLELPAQRVWTSPGGHTLVDFGQNLVGWVRFEVTGPSGSTITIKYAEVLEHDELGTRPLRSARATDRFILSGGVDRFEPTLTFHGFRYAQVEGWPGELTPESLTAIVVHSDFPRTGHFECSDDMLNQLHRNVVWGTRGNFVDVPTDCPQRDERLGWTGDIAVFAPTAAFLFDVKDFLRDWQADLMAEQLAAAGRVPYVIPDPLKYDPKPFEDWPQESTAIWADAAVWVPWALWQAYADPQVLVESIDSMRDHLRRVESLLSDTGLWDTGFQFGDWLDPDAPPNRPEEAKADPGVVATACLYRSATIAAQAAIIVDRPDDAEYFRALADRTRIAFTKHYVADGGRIRSDSVTVYALAIHFDLLNEDSRDAAGLRLAELVAANGFRIATGFAGTPYVADALTATGHLDHAYALLQERQCPSWLYSVSMGATTIWERWDSMLPDGTINAGEMTSFNHYALGAIADWMHHTIGGLAPAEPGYRRIRVAPRPGGGLTWARTSLDTPQGIVTVVWRQEPTGALDVDITLPEGVSADVELPGAPTFQISSSERFTVAT
ncbi:MAG TPA: family 78 glycoside hydrolase catalytic domain [Nakamurella sp.]